MIFLQLFITFFKIGLLGFGGGYAMISMIQGEVVTAHHWMSMQQFTDIVAISQMTPGPIGINSATYVGYEAALQAGFSPAVAVLGSAVATVSVILPSFLLMLTLTKLLVAHRDSHMVQSVFGVLRPAVVGLIGAAALLLMTKDNFSSPDVNPWQFGVSVFLFCATFAGVKWFGVGVIRMICYAAVAGLVLY